MTKSTVMPARYAERFRELALALEPRHLTKSGKATEDQVTARYRHIKAEWGFLEGLLGRKVTESEV